MTVYLNQRMNKDLKYLIGVTCRLMNKPQNEGVNHMLYEYCKQYLTEAGVWDAVKAKLDTDVPAKQETVDTTTEELTDDPLAAELQ